MEISINYLAVLAAAIVSMVLGMLWYSPMLFGKAWVRLSGLSQEKMEEQKKKGMAKTYALAFLGSFVTAYVLAHFAARWDAKTLSDAWQLAFWAWLGFVVTTQLGLILWEGKPAKLYFLNIAYYLVNFGFMTSVLVLWK